MPRSSILRLASVLAAISLLSACEKDIDLDLNTSSSRLVIEANLADDGRPCEVRLSQSVNYAESNSFPAVRGATVTLRDDAGPQETLREASPGRYVGRLLGTTDHRYSLTVVASGQTYEATSTLPAPVPITNVRLETVSFGPEERLAVVPEFTDPAGVRNYYYFRQVVNGERKRAIYLQDDELTDGNPSRRPLRGGFDEEKLESGDSLQLEIRNVDAGNYEYLRTLNQILGADPLFTATPANPASNFSGGALGYFSAHALQRRRLRVP